MSDHQVVALWRKLFREQTVTSETVAEAALLLDELGPESPLRVRLAKELKEIEKMHLSV